MCQHAITADEARDAYILLATWEHEIEQLYYQSREDQLHFIRPCVHQVLHLAPETIQKGLPICYAQWTLERTIGNLKYDIRQPSNYQENFAQQGVRRAKINALLAAIPTLDDTKKGLPHGAVDLGDGFVLLRKRDKHFVHPPHGTSQAILEFLGEQYPQAPRIKRWARVLLPNGQIARSAWRETLLPLERLHVSRMLKFKVDNQITLGEALYYTQLAITNDLPNPITEEDPFNNHWIFANVALVQLFSSPDEQLLNLSHQTILSCIALQDIQVIPIKNIISVVAMIPHTPREPGEDDDDDDDVGHGEDE
ncbi:hypothetical protein PAXRUDRAFT_12457 [Paxillus rubicundulus Ve08.2h10]|uniref:Uncharacterized protein n=1 Tax=Paxillus rubicundulus Ve08.2h10 TaxID=930991 RepID=A0A0D0DVU5_9AGAM|nr:hypothetical protein PAXRUDRAFT_12457 [Paxillus rubicundulus Ve08.2h10]